MCAAMVAENNNVRQFYVYQHRRNDTGEVFYVGKGSGGRAWLVARRNSYWINIARKYGRTVEILCDGIDEEFAFLLERELIAKTGRYDVGLGPLANMTDGGEGASGHVPTDATIAKYRARKRAALSPEARRRIGDANRGRVKTVETREKLSKAHTGRKQNPEHIAKSAASRRGLTHSTEVRAKISAAQTGKKKSEEHIAKMADSKRGQLLKNNTSGYANVYFVKSKNKWAARVPSPRRKIPGYYDTKEDAIAARGDYVSKIGA